MPGPLPIADLEHILSHTAPVWEAMRGERLFISGGTGFFGRWLLESLLFAEEKLGLGLEAIVLTRDPRAFLEKTPHLRSRRGAQFVEGDVRTFAFPGGRFARVIHAATEASAKLNEENPLLMLDTIVGGTRRMLEFAAQSGAKSFLLTSSGAVYRPQPPELERVGEDFRGAPDPAHAGSAYGEGKRVAELLCHIFARRHGFAVKIARGFAFAGPGLPLDTHFALGNFIRAALVNEPIVIQGDGTPLRSYLYAADLAIWLWTILISGADGRVYNVGSASALSIAELAGAVRATLGKTIPIEVEQKPAEGKRPDRYVPDVTRAAKELGLREWIGLEEGIRRTARWSAGEIDGTKPRS